MLLFVRRWSYFLPCVYLMASIPVFEHIYKVARVVVDEEFHLPQGKHYCTGNFQVVGKLAAVEIKEKFNIQNTTRIF